MLENKSPFSFFLNGCLIIKDRRFVVLLAAGDATTSLAPNMAGIVMRMTKQTARSKWRLIVNVYLWPPVALFFFA